MDDDFDNDLDLVGDGLDDSLTEDLGDLGDTGDVDVDAESFDEADETSVLGGSRSSGGARVLTSMSGLDPAPKKASPAAKKAAPKKAAPRKAARKAPARKKAAPKKKARKAGSKK